MSQKLAVTMGNGNTRQLSQKVALTENSYHKKQSLMKNKGYEYAV